QAAPAAASTPPRPRQVPTSVPAQPLPVEPRSHCERRPDKSKLVAHPAIHAGFWPAITRRQSPPSLLPRLAALAASECGLWLGARDPETRRHHWTGHRLGGNGFRLFRLLCLGLGLCLRGLVRLLLWLAGLLARLRDRVVDRPGHAA